jgi:ATP-binding cassette subfamily F protein 3
MIQITLENVAKRYGADTILDNVSLSLRQGGRLGVVGVNGAGKTTLLRLVAGELTPDEGTVRKPEGLKVGYLAQESMAVPQGSPWEEMLTVFEDVFRMEEKLRGLEAEMSERHADEAGFARLSEEYARLTERFEEANGYGYRSAILGVLKGLGFDDEQINRKASTLSGGQQSRLALAKLLLGRPDILLLDEPTNHLDIESTQWLEDFIKDFPNTAVIVSHDRYFLDAVCDSIAEISFGRLTSYEGNFTEYMIQREERAALQQKAYELNRREIRRHEEIIRRYRQYNREKSIRAARSWEKKLARIERVEKARGESSVRFSFETARRTGSNVLIAEGLSKSFGPVRLFKGLDLHIRAGDRVGVVGRNGIGKTTLLRILMEEIPQDEGFFRWGAGVQAGYYDQKQQGLTPEKTVMDEVWDAYPTLEPQRIRDMLGAFLFRGDAVGKRVDDLSGGERGRVALAKLLLGKYNVLLLDEPTNHLDILSCQALEDALLDFDGTLLFVSHDRYFINRIATRILEMADEGVSDYPGDWDEYTAHKAMEGRPPEENDGLTKTERRKQDKLSRQSEAEQRERRRLVKQLEKKIAAVEAEIAETEAKLSDPGGLSEAELAELSGRHELKTRECDGLISQWEEALRVLEETD